MATYIEDSIITFREKIIDYYYKVYHEEYQTTANIVLNFVRETDRILCGEYALRRFLGDVPIYADIYGNDFRVPEIMFYSPNSIDDTNKLMDRIKEGAPFIEGLYAEKKSNFNINISGSFGRIATIRYCPGGGFAKIRSIEIDKIPLKVMSPDLMRAHIYDILTDPLLSASKWASYVLYNIMFGKRYKELKGKSETNIAFKKDLYNEILETVKHFSHNVILVGQCAIELCIDKKVSGTGTIEILSFDLFATLQRVRQRFGLKYDLEKFHNDFYKERAIFNDKDSGRPILIVYNVGGQCIPNYYMHGYYVGLYHVILRYLYINGIHDQDIPSGTREHNAYLVQLLTKAREKLLKEHGLEGIENEAGPYRILDTLCSGRRLSEFRDFRIAAQKNKDIRYRRQL